MTMDVKGMACTLCLADGYRCPAYEWDDQQGTLCIGCINAPPPCRHTAGIGCKPVSAENRVNHPARTPEPIREHSLPKIEPKTAKPPLLEGIEAAKIRAKRTKSQNGEKTMSGREDAHYEPRTCACGCGEAFAPTGPRSKYKEGHRPGATKKASTAALVKRPVRVKATLAEKTAVTYEDVDRMVAHFKSRIAKMQTAIDALEDLR